MTKFAIRLLIILLPMGVTLMFTSFFVQANLLASTPVWEDEIGYWHQIETFKAVGFSGGYYTYEEVAARAAFTHFSTHGPAFIGVFGLLARLTGWTYATMPLYNLAILTAAVGVFVLVVPLNRRQSLAFALLLCTSWGLHLFITKNMQEPTHFAIGIVAAAIFYRILSHPTSLRWKIAFAAFFAFAGLFRLTWALLLLPLMLMDVKTPRSAFIALLFACTIIGIEFFLFGYWGAPYPLNFSTTFLSVFAESPIEGIGLLLSWFTLNLQRMRLGHPLEIVQRYQIILIVILLLTIWAAQRGRATLRRIRAWFPLSQSEILLHVFNLGGIFLLQLLVYDVFAWRDYRVLAPHLLLSAALLIAINRLRLTGFILLVNILSAIWFFSIYPDFYPDSEGIDLAERDRRYESSADLEQFAATIAPYIVYDEQTANAWCNTLLTDTFSQQLVTLPAGIGFSITLDPTAFGNIPKSRYLLFKPENFGTIGAQTRVQKLTATEAGDLYLNLAADCGA